LNKKEMKQQALMMLRCQLKIFPDWKKLYDSAIESLFGTNIYNEEYHNYVRKMAFSAPDMFVNFAKAKEGEEFWFKIDERIRHEMTKKGKWELVPDIPSIIEVDENE
jgi:hypothetical protein